MKAREISDMERLDRMEQTINLLQKNMEKLILVTNHAQQQNQLLAREIFALSNSSQPFGAANQKPPPHNQPISEEIPLLSSDNQIMDPEANAEMSENPDLIPDYLPPKRPTSTRRRGLPHQRCSVQGTSDTNPRRGPSLRARKAAEQQPKDRNSYDIASMMGPSLRMSQILNEDSGEPSNETIRYQQPRLADTSSAAEVSRSHDETTA